MPRSYLVEVASGADVVAPLTEPSWSTLADVQSVSVNVGQNYTLDQIGPSSATFEARYPTGFAVPNTALKVGNQIRVSDVKTGRLQWRGRMTNVQVNIQGPQSLTAPYDTVIISAEGSLSDWGRTERSQDKDNLQEFLDRCAEIARGNFTSTVIGSTADNLGRLPSGTTYMTALQAHQTQHQFVVRDAGPVPARTGTSKRQAHLEILMPGAIETSSVNFSDTTSSATQQKIDSAQLLSATESFFTTATITPLAGTVAAQTSGSGDWDFTATSASRTTSDAKNLADWIVNVYGSSPFVTSFGSSPYVVAEVSISSEAQSTWAADLGLGLWKTPGNYVTLTARSTTFDLMVIGGTLTATPDSSRYSYRVIPASWRNFFVLNSSTFGVLDSNRLGIQ